MVTPWLIGQCGNLPAAFNRRYVDRSFTEVIVGIGSMVGPDSIRIAHRQVGDMRGGLAISDILLSRTR